MGGVSGEVLVARAFLSRVAEPTCIPLWAFVAAHGPVDAVTRIRRAQAPDEVMHAVRARCAMTDPEADLEAAERHGIRLLVPEDADWPHVAAGAFRQVAARRLAEWSAGERRIDLSGEPIPPLALWVKGRTSPAGLGLEPAVAIVGSRAATDYGTRVAAEFAYDLARRDILVVSGGAHGIDAAAHRGALAAEGTTVLVSAGGLDRPYPPSNAGLYARIAESGLLVSESPPGAAPHRGRFLTRNRLIAAFARGTVVVEAATRSGAQNTVRHSRTLQRPVMVVPGPITSAMSRGCHHLLRTDRHALLVTDAEQVHDIVGSLDPLAVAAPVTEANAGRTAGPTAGRTVDEVPALRAVLDSLDPVARRVFEGLRPRRAAGVDELAAITAVPVRDVLRAVPALELAGLADASARGYVIGKAYRTPPAAVARGAESTRGLSTDTQ